MAVDFSTLTPVQVTVFTELLRDKQAELGLDVIVELLASRTNAQLITRLESHAADRVAELEAEKAVLDEQIAFYMSVSTP